MRIFTIKQGFEPLTNIFRCLLVKTVLKPMEKKAKGRN